MNISQFPLSHEHAILSIWLLAFCFGFTQRAYIKLHLLVNWNNFINFPYLIQQIFKHFLWYQTKTVSNVKGIIWNQSFPTCVNATTGEIEICNVCGRMKSRAEISCYIWQAIFKGFFGWFLYTWTDYCLKSDVFKLWVATKLGSQGV